MDRLQMATLMSLAGRDGAVPRRQLQECAYALQSAGCGLGCR